MKRQRPDFTATRWSLISNAKSPDSKESRRALEELCQLYWLPLYSFLRMKGEGREEAEDLTQGFFAMALEKELIPKADEVRGKFRTYMLTLLTRYQANQWDKANALKRGGGRVISLDGLDAEGRYQKEDLEGLTPEAAFEKTLALELFRAAREELREEYQQEGRGDLFHHLQAFLYDGDKSMKDLAVALETSESKAKSWTAEMKKRFRRLIRARVRETLVDPDDVNEELAYLQQSVR